MRCQGVKFLLAGGQWYMAFMPEMQARELVKKWARGEYDNKSYIAGQAQVIPGVTSGEDWCFSVSNIIGMHTFEVLVQQQSPTQQSQFPLGSGIYFK